MKLDVNVLIAIGTFLTGAGGTAIAGLRAYNKAQRKQFEAERAVAHLQNDYKTLSETVVRIDTRQEELFDFVAEMRGALTVVLRQAGVPNPDLPTMNTQELRK